MAKLEAGHRASLKGFGFTDEQLDKLETKTFNIAALLKLMQDVSANAGVAVVVADVVALFA